MADHKNRFKSFETHGHKYTVSTHDTTEALPIVGALLSAIPGPLLRAIQLLREKNPDASMLDLNLSDLANIDLGDMGQDLSTAIEKIAARPELIKELFKHTTRDGDALRGGTFEAAYSGNWGEFYAALFQIVKVNGFIPLSSTSTEQVEE